MHPDETYKKTIGKFFSGNKGYWRKVYKKNQDNRNSTLRMEMIKRKEFIQNYLLKNITSNSQVILDVGCGAGGILEDIIERGYNTIGADISFDMIKDTIQMSRKYRNEGILCLQSDIEYLPFNDNSFSFIICAGVIQYLREDKHAIAKIAGILKIDGIILLTIPNILRINNFFDIIYLIRLAHFGIHKLTGIYKHSSNLKKNRDPHKNTDFSNRRYFYWQLHNLFKRHNLKIIQTFSIGFGPITLLRKNILPLSWSISISDFVENLSQKNIFSFLKIFANRWVFCLQKVK